MKQILIFADADADEKAAACAEAANHILEYVRSKGLEDRLLTQLVHSCVTSVSIESYTRDACSDQVRDEIYRETIAELAKILGMRMEMMDFQSGSTN